MNAELLVARKRRGLTQQELAEKAGLPHYSDISRIEKAGWMPPLDVQQRIADALDVTTSEIFHSQQVAS